MKITRFLAIAAVAAAGMFSAAGSASAQYYYPQQEYRPYYRGPAYVPPRIARKQAQQRQRFIEKYGYQQRAPRRYYGNQGYYGQPRYNQPYYRQPGVNTYVDPGSGYRGPGGGGGPPGGGGRW